jgi:hypothetical protein
MSGSPLRVRLFVDQMNFVVVVQEVVQLGGLVLQAVAKALAAEADVDSHYVDLDLFERKENKKFSFVQFF